MEQVFADIDEKPGVRECSDQDQITKISAASARPIKFTVGSSDHAAQVSLMNFAQLYLGPGGLEGKIQQRYHKSFKYVHSRRVHSTVRSTSDIRCAARRGTDVVAQIHADLVLRNRL